ncbi:MAG: SEL1-like repeat protein [Woeseiaceae bacterium]|nr:SEL1-like repeat protein [Woeseiaceae bacterium]
MKTRLAIITGLLAGLCCASTGAQDYKPFPGVSADQRTLETQQRVDELFDAGNYQRAFFIYQKELAPRGDKYAQYMVGYMYLNGLGVERDPAQALAWYRLSAERGNQMLVEVRDALAKELSATEIVRSNDIFASLLKSYGDTTLLMKLIRRDMDILKQRTGTHIPAAGVNAPIQIIRPSGLPEDPNFYSNVRKRLESRLAYLETTVEINDIELETESSELRNFEEEIRADLRDLEVP